MTPTFPHLASGLFRRTYRDNTDLPVARHKRKNPQWGTSEVFAHIDRGLPVHEFLAFQVAFPNRL